MLSHPPLRGIFTNEIIQIKKLDKVLKSVYNSIITKETKLVAFQLS